MKTEKSKKEEIEIRQYDYADTMPCALTIGLAKEGDDKERLETVFIDYLNVEDTVMNRTKSRNWLINALRNLQHPCRDYFRHMLVLVGESGCANYLMEKLFTLDGVPYFKYINPPKRTDTKSFVENIDSVWAIGLNGRNSLVKDDFFMDKMNAPITYSHYYESDTYRPHNCVFATSNDMSLLNDDYIQRNKKFWVLPYNISEYEFYEKIKNLTPKEVKQIWAEADIFSSYPRLNLELNLENIEIEQKHRLD